MKIDRTRFLVLTSALAAAACVVVDHKPVPPPPPPPPPPAHAAAAPAHIVFHEPPHGATPAPAPGTHPVIVFHQPQPLGTPTAPPAPGPTPPPPAPTPTPTSVCLDSSTSAVPACAVSCPSNPFMAQRCATYTANFDSKVATSAVTCMNGLTGAAACDSSQAYGCGKTALSQACPDPNTVSQLCQIASGPCKVAANDCTTMISGLSPAGQDAVAQCIAKGCSAGLYSCIEGLSPSSTASATHH